MHELAITESMIKIALTKAEEIGAKRIIKINLKIGRLSGYVPEAVEMNFQLLTAGTRAEGAELNIQWVPIRCSCSLCHSEYLSEVPDLVCKKCGKAGGKIVGGREMFIDSLEVDN